MMQTLPRWVQWGAAIGFMALPLTACSIAFAANMAYGWQYGPAWVAVGVFCSVGLVILPIASAINGSWSTRAKILYGAAALFNALTAIQLAADDRFAGMFVRSEAVSSYEDNKDNIARMARDLSLISEVSTPAALKGQIAALEAEIKTQNSLIEVHTDPKQKGPCKTTCEGYKLKLSAQQEQLGKLNDRLGQAIQREQLEAGLRAARETRDAGAPPKKAGLAVILNKVTLGKLTEQQVDMALLIIMTALYLLIIEVATYLSGPAASVMMHVATTKPVTRVEAVIEDVVEPFPAVLGAPVGFVPQEIAPAMVQVEIREIPVTLAELEKKPRKRRADGRFAKKPGPKSKLKLNDLVKKSDNVVKLGDFKKD